MKEELLKKLIDGAYSCSCNHGFHDKELSVRHCLMLVITEVSEAVEADRLGLHSDLDMTFCKEDSLISDDEFYPIYTDFVKPSVEAELADVCIRIFDLCGMLGIVPKVPSTDASAMEFFSSVFGEDTFCERMYELACLLSEYSDGDENLNDKDFMEEKLGSSLFLIMCLCKDMGIDIMKHIELKMRYNALRPILNGKMY